MAGNVNEVKHGNECVPCICNWYCTTAWLYAHCMCIGKVNLQGQVWTIHDRAIRHHTILYYVIRNVTLSHLGSKRFQVLQMWCSTLGSADNQLYCALPSCLLFCVRIALVAMFFFIVVTWARVICLICMPKGAALGLWAYISGKLWVPMLQILCNTFKGW